MASLEQLTQLSDRLLNQGYPKEDVNRYNAYLYDTINAESTKDKRPVSGNDVQTLYSLYTKYANLGLVVDGVNVVITGRNMAMVTYHGYKNKVLQVYPEASFDAQLVREGDTFNVSKDNGDVMYSHQFGDPFGNTAIIGAYVVIKTKRGEYLELLNVTDYNQMKSQSKQSNLWNKWDSEFWLKSVMKRACKRHFNDITADLDKVDNDDYGLAEPTETNDVRSVLSSINKAASIADISSIMRGLSPETSLLVSEAAEIRVKELAAEPA